ncbi:hypothetical protein EDD30_6588 [Couchioplanes caeruleus]|uniref:Uncharacterized protein n=1 Tax=Couchioplanes caeruleus TaxID=56438 RepID=A0A3N1GTQ6_9ACTN|nr:hypothetical protein EDD30_6588 [Couchioplanes caeruleus]
MLLFALTAFVRGNRGRSVARFGAALAWLRLGLVASAVWIIAASLGPSAIAGTLETSGAVAAVIDALAAVFVTGVAVRRTRHG